MKKLTLLTITGIFGLLSGCCHCKEDFPFVNVKFENFSPAELQSIYLVSDGIPDTCFTCVDSTSNSMFLFVTSNSRHQILSDSIPLNKVIEVKKIKSESSRYFLCDPCIDIISINYELDGVSYSNEPAVIKK